MSWTQEQTLLFLKLFQTESIIWDPKHKDYKDKKKKYDAWMRLESLLNVPVEELKQKKDSLLATYRGYSRKVKAGIKTSAEAGDVYRPVWFAYDTIDQFLGSIFKCRSSINTVQETEAKDIEEEKEALMDTSDILHSDLNESALNSQSRNSSESTRVETKKYVRRQRYNLPAPVKSLINRRVSELEDECDIFGKLIAKKLKKLPENKREDLMFDIYALFRSTKTKRNNFSCVNCKFKTE